MKFVCLHCGAINKNKHIMTDKGAIDRNERTELEKKELEDALDSTYMEWVEAVKRWESKLIKFNKPFELQDFTHWLMRKNRELYTPANIFYLKPTKYWRCSKCNQKNYVSESKRMTLKGDQPWKV